MTSPADKLRDAAAIIEGRDKYHGNYRVNFLNTAAFWTRYLGVPVSAEDVAVMFCLAKISRMISGGKTNGDDYDDLTGYAGLAAAIHEAEHGEETLE
jgi:hypothetical protein